MGLLLPMLALALVGEPGADEVQWERREQAWRIGGGVGVATSSVGALLMLTGVACEDCDGNAGIAASGAPLFLGGIALAASGFAIAGRLHRRELARDERDYFLTNTMAVGGTGVGVGVGLVAGGFLNEVVVACGGDVCAGGGAGPFLWTVGGVVTGVSLTVLAVAGAQRVGHRKTRLGFDASGLVLRF